MKNEEAIVILNKDIDHWKKIIGRFEHDSYWYGEGVKKIRALKTAVAAIKELERLQNNSIEFGKDYWKDIFKIDEKVWVTSDGVPVRNSFSIRPLESTTTSTEDSDEDD